MRYLLLVASLALCACDDGTTGGDPSAEDMRVTPDAAAADQGGAEPEPMPEPGEPEPMPEGEPEPARECDAGERVCLEEGGIGIRYCGDDGLWAFDRCAEDEICIGAGDCIPSGRGCREGERVCLDPGLPGVCNPGQGWTPGEPCPIGTVCTGAGACTDPACAAADRSYLGCDYVVVDLPNAAWSEGNTPEAPLGVVIANPDLGTAVQITALAADGTVEALVAERELRAGAFFAGQYPPVTVQTEIWDADRQVVESAFDRAEQLEIPAGGMAVLLFQPERSSNASRVRAAARRILSTAPVAAYQFGPYCCNFSFTNDASLLLPVPALGTDYRYLGVPVFAERFDPGEGFEPSITAFPAAMTIVGTQDRTEVRIDLPPGIDVIPDADGRMQIQGRQVTATLEANEILDVLSMTAEERRDELYGGDFSGAVISSSKPVAVFSGHECTHYPQDRQACDHLEEQLIPTDTWGRGFILAPAIQRGADGLTDEATYWKITGLNPGARVQLSQPLSQLANLKPPGFRGVPDCADHLAAPDVIVLPDLGYCEFGTTSALRIEGDGPLQVLGIISGSASTGFGAMNPGDPAIFFATPESQYRINYAFIAPGTYANDVLTVTLPADAEVQIDGMPADVEDRQMVPGTAFEVRHIRIDDGPHRVSADRPFAILVFGFDDVVSYAFTGGLNLNKR